MVILTNETYKTIYDKALLLESGPGVSSYDRDGLYGEKLARIWGDPRYSIKCPDISRLGFGLYVTNDLYVFAWCNAVYLPDNVRLLVRGSKRFKKMPPNIGYFKSVTIEYRGIHE